jgi:hypothetical protein
MRDVLVVGALVGAVLWAAGYAVACWVWPFAYCRRCGGTGKRHSPTGKRFRRCGKCGGTGWRLRRGRRLWNWYQR